MFSQKLIQGLLAETKVGFRTSAMISHRLKRVLCKDGGLMAQFCKTVSIKFVVKNWSFVIFPVLGQWLALFAVFPASLWGFTSPTAGLISS